VDLTPSPRRPGLPALCAIQPISGIGSNFPSRPIETSKAVVCYVRSTSIPAGRSMTSHVETLAAETSGLTRPLILERGSIVFRRRLMPWEWRRLACACQRCQDGAPELSCRPALPTFFQKFQTAATHKTSSLCIAVAHAGGHRSRAHVFWPWISFPSRRSFIQSWR
jgi:hypothetical protein